MTSNGTFGTSSGRARVRTVDGMIPHLLAFAIATAETPTPDAPSPPPRTSVHGLGGPLVGVTSIGDGAALLTGGRGGVLLDRTWFFGLSVEGTPLLDGFQTALGDGRKIGHWQVGPLVEASPFDHAVVHPRLGMAVGGAWIGTDGPRGRESTFAFVAEPTATLELTMSRFLRLGANAGYRFAMPTSSLVRFSEASGVVVGVSIQLGFVD